MTTVSAPAWAPATIVAAYDGSDEAIDGLHLARALAELTGQALEAVHVLLRAGKLPDERRALREFEAELQHSITASLDGHPCNMTTMIDRSPEDALRQLTRDPDVGMLVLGPTHRNVLTRLILGTGAEYVVPHAAVPVAVAPAGFRDRPEIEPAAIGVAHDGTAAAEGALSLGVDLALRRRASLRLIRIGAAEGLDAVAARVRAAHPGLEVDADVLSGDAAAQLTEQPVGCLVAGRHHHALLRRMLVGTVATKLSAHPRVPIVFR